MGEGFGVGGGGGGSSVILRVCWSGTLAEEGLLQITIPATDTGAGRGRTQRGAELIVGVRRVLARTNPRGWRGPLARHARACARGAAGARRFGLLVPGAHAAQAVRRFGKGHSIDSGDAGAERSAAGLVCGRCGGKVFYCTYLPR